MILQCILRHFVDKLVSLQKSEQSPAVVVITRWDLLFFVEHVCSEFFHLFLFLVLKNQRGRENHSLVLAVLSMNKNVGVGRLVDFSLLCEVGSIHFRMSKYQKIYKLLKISYNPI